MDRIIVTGAGGFIGHHLAKRLKAEGHWVLGIDRRLPEFEASVVDDFCITDLRSEVAAGNCFSRLGRVDKVYHLAADVGGCAFSVKNGAVRLRNNALIDANVFVVAQRAGAAKFVYASSTSVYDPGLGVLSPFAEDDAWPVGRLSDFSKMFGERLCAAHHDQFGMRTYAARLASVYGPQMVYDNDRARVVASACYKLALARLGDVIPIWGDGEQVRTYLYIDDCVEGLIQMGSSDEPGPLNIGSDETVTVRQLYNIVAMVSGKQVTFEYEPARPCGVKYRCSDHTRLKSVLGWEPEYKLVDGIIPTYEWLTKSLM